MSLYLSITCFAIALATCAANAQVQVDSTFEARVPTPEFKHGGPVVLIDEAHHNAHTMSGRYRPFAALLQHDGFRVASLKEPVSTLALNRAAVLVIANASAPDQSTTANFPVAGAFAPEEIETIRKWVHSGGSLLLIADHPPWAGAAESLAKAFGVFFRNGYAMREPGRYENFAFRVSDSSLAPRHPIIRGRRSSERITTVVTFTGQAFRAPGFQPLLRLPDGVSLFLPVRPGDVTPATPKIDAAGMLQGAVTSYGQGRIAVFGEAAMFSAQLLGSSHEKLGMNHPDASENKQFVLNVLHWLARRLG